MSDVQPAVAATTLDLYTALGPIAGLGDGDQTYGWPLLRFLDGVGQIVQRCADLADDDPAGNPGWSLLLDPDRCPTYALPWLAQLVGVRFDQTQTTGAAQRAAIKAEQGFTRGTPAALKAAAAKWLGPNQSVTVFERDTDAYHFTVVVTLGALKPATYSGVSVEYATYSAWTAATSSYSTPAYPEVQLQAALASQKPGGLLMAVTIATGVPYGTLTSEWGAYSTLAGEYPPGDYAAMINATH